MIRLTIESRYMHEWRNAGHVALSGRRAKYSKLVSCDTASSWLYMQSPERTSFAGAARFIRLCLIGSTRGSQEKSLASPIRQAALSDFIQPYKQLASRQDTTASSCLPDQAETLSQSRSRRSPRTSRFCHGLGTSCKGSQKSAAAFPRSGSMNIYDRNQF